MRSTSSARLPGAGGLRSLAGRSRAPASILLQQASHAGSTVTVGTVRVLTPRSPWHSEHADFTALRPIREARERLDLVLVAQVHEAAEGVFIHRADCVSEPAQEALAPLL